jgi:hypothetical protein
VVPDEFDRAIVPEHGDTCRPARFVLHDIDRQAVFDDAGVHAGTKPPHEGALDLRAGGIAAGMQDPAPGVRRLLTELECVALDIESRALLQEPADRRRAALHQPSGRSLVREPRSGLQRVREVQVCRVIRPDCGGHSALGVPGVGFPKLALGDHRDPERVGQSQRE